MTMAEMDKYLKDRGFDVDRKYDNIRNAYRFTIRKDGKFFESYFKYPGRDDWGNRNRIMKEFINHMIYEFERIHGSKEKTHFLKDLGLGDLPQLLLLNGHTYPVRITKATHECRAYDNDGITFSGEALSPFPNETNYFVAARGQGKSTFLMNMLNAVYGSGHAHLDIEKVIFNYPATIVFWKDGTKTVVKAQNDEVFDKEKGLVMAIVKKAFGNEGNYYEQIKKWL